MLIDVHQHLLPDFLIDAYARAGRRPALAAFPAWSVEGALEVQDRLGIGRTILSISTPGVHFGEDKAAADLARRCNDYCGALLATTGGRLDAFAALPLPCVDAAMAEAARALDEVGLAGVGLFASYAGRFLGDPLFDPLLAELDRRGAVVFVHPMGHPSSAALGLAAPLWMAEYPIDTSRAAINLIVSGAKARFAGIRFILAHAGGTLPFLSVRLRAASLIDARLGDLTPERIDAEIGSFYYELAQATGKATLATLAMVTTPDHVLFGTDHPYCSRTAVDDMVSHLADVPGGRCLLAANGAALLREARHEG